MTKNAPDIVLWNELRNGSYEAFEAIYAQHIHDLSLYGHRLTSNRMLLEDALQDVFVNLWRRKSNLGEVTNLRYYLLKSLRNRLVRIQTSEFPEVADDMDAFLDRLVTLSNEQRIVEQEVDQLKRQSVQNALKHLSPRQMEAIHLKFYQGLSHERIATMMDVSIQYVSNLLSRAYAVLRAAMQAVFSFLLFLTGSSI